MKVLSIIKTMDSSHGGPPEVLRNQLNVINKKKKIIDVMRLDLISTVFFLKCLFFNSYRSRIYNLLKKYDMIHFHEIWSIKIIIVVYFANKLLIKHFFVGHGYLDTWSINEKFVKKKAFIIFFLQKAYNSSFASFFSTFDEYREAKKNLKIFNPFIIPNGVSLFKFRKRKLQIKTKKKILFFGRIHPKKGLDLLMNTIKILPKEFFEKFIFEITGPGEKKHISNLKKLIKDYSLENYVFYNNPVYGERKIPYLQQNDIFILPSFEEGDSIALKEALASYLPVVISKQCRLDVVTRYEAGIVVETNKKSLYEALIKLNDVDLVYMGNQARKLIEEEFDNEKCSSRLLDIYFDIYNGIKISNDWIV